MSWRWKEALRGPNSGRSEISFCKVEEDTLHDSSLWLLLIKAALWNCRVHSNLPALVTNFSPAIPLDRSSSHSPHQYRECILKRQKERKLWGELKSQMFSDFFTLNLSVQRELAVGKDYHNFLPGKRFRGVKWFAQDHSATTHGRARTWTRVAGVQGLFLLQGPMLPFWKKTWMAVYDFLCQLQDCEVQVFGLSNMITILDEDKKTLCRPILQPRDISTCRMSTPTPPEVTASRRYSSGILVVCGIRYGRLAAWSPFALLPPSLFSSSEVCLPFGCENL